MTEKEFAIDRIKRSMATHQEWLDHFEWCDCQDWAETTVGNAEHHRTVLTEYQRVLNLLESIPDNYHTEQIKGRDDI